MNGVPNVHPLEQEGEWHTLTEETGTDRRCHDHAKCHNTHVIAEEMTSLTPHPVPARISTGCSSMNSNGQ